MISLITATKPEKKTAKRTHLKAVKAARYEDVDTGEKKIETIVNENDERVERLIPIMRRERREAEYEEIETEIDVWIVETFDGENTEQHEFTSEEDANHYYEGLNK